MYIRLYSLVCFVCLALSTSAQTPFTLDGSWMFADVSLHVSDKSGTTTALLDTGCTACFMDSTYAADHFSIVVDTLPVCGLNSDKHSVHYTYLEKVDFCGQTFKDVYFCITDLKKMLPNRELRFIIGGDLLDGHAWRFDMEKKLIEVCDARKRYGSYAVKWHSYDEKNRIYQDIILDDCTVDGKKLWMVFDTGATSCTLPKGTYEGVPDTVKTLHATLTESLDTVYFVKYRDKRLSSGKWHIKSDFTVRDNDHYGLLNLSFLKGHSFVLNYRKRIIDII